MNNDEKRIYLEANALITLRFACCHLRSELNILEICVLKWHLQCLKLSYCLRKAWFSWSLFTKNNWSPS